MTYGERIRHYRKREGLSQADIGRAVGVSSQAVSKWEHDLSEPDSDAQKVLCVLFHISADELLGTNKKDPQPQKPEVEDVVQLAVSLNPESLKLGKAYLQALHDVERANNRKP